MTRLLPRPRLFTAPRPAPVRRAPRRVRARRAVFVGLVVAVLAQLGLNVALDTAKPEWRDPEYGHRVKRLKAQVAAAPGRPVVVALGSSRVEMGFSPGHLGLGDGPDSPVVYNLSAAGCGPLHELLNLKRLLADGVKPDYLLVEVLRPTLAGNGPAEKLVIPARLSLADLRRVEPYCDDPWPLRAAWARTRVAPWYTYRQLLMSHSRWLAGWLKWQDRQDFMWAQMEPDGWLPYFHPEVSAEKRADGTAQAHAQYAAYFAHFAVAPLPDRAYRDLLALCREHGIRVAFFVMPEAPTFRAWYPPGAQEHVRDYLAGLSREYGAPVFDASAWAPDDAAFADTHHMLRHGAEAFSARFGRECLGPWLGGTRPAVDGPKAPR